MSYQRSMAEDLVEALKALRFSTTLLDLRLEKEKSPAVKEAIAINRNILAKYPNLK